MNILEKLWFRAKTGADIVDLGRADETVIRFKNLYISLLIGEDGEIKSMGWSESPLNSTPVKDYWIAKPPRKLKGDK